MPSTVALLSAILSHPANRGRRVRALLRALGFQLARRVTRGALRIDYHGFTLFGPADNHSASRAVYFAGLPDHAEMRFMIDYLRAGDTFIDVGANVGLYTLLALSRVGPGGRVHAFEPNPHVADVLEETIRENGAGNVTVHRLGVSDRAGTLAFRLTGDDCTAHISPQAAQTGLAVDVIRLDRFLADVPCAMAKFDIEGHEPFAIRGLSRWTAAGNPPVMLVEVGGYSKRYGVTTADFIDELERLGYFTAIYDPHARRLRPTRTPWLVPVTDVLAVSRARQAFVERRLAASVPDRADSTTGA